jgi:signal recognition particle subunit SRP54
MAFDSLTEKFQNVFKSLRGKGRLSEEDVQAALKEVKLALLEADVNFKVVKEFVKKVQERAVGQDVLNGLNPAQTVIKIVNEEMTNLLGETAGELKYESGQTVTIIMMVGLQGAGKTTTAAKLAAKIKEKGKNPLLVPMDVYRPAAKDQLVVNGDKVGVKVFDSDMSMKVPDIAKAALDYANKNNHKVILLDTAGRLHVDEDMMQELSDVKNVINVSDTVLVVDAMTGQDAVNVAKSFDEKVGIDGVILTKLDGDTRGGAALSIRAVTGKPIYYAGMGEKLSDLEVFFPDRMASRILGMGDVLSLIEKAEASIDQEAVAKLSKKVKKADFDYNDYLLSMEQMKKMGGITSLLGMMPGMSSKQTDAISSSIDDKKLAHTSAIIQSMTLEERENPALMNISRKNRLAKGAGVDIAEVNRFVKQFNESKKMMKKMPGMMKGMGKNGKFRFPF